MYLKLLCFEALEKDKKCHHNWSYILFGIKRQSKATLFIIYMSHVNLVGSRFYLMLYLLTSDRVLTQPSFIEEVVISVCNLLLMINN